MSAAPRLPDSARYWRTPLVPDADLLTATYRDHAFAPHWHDAYTIPVILEGAERFTYRGTGYVAETGTVPVINPGEVHTGSRAADEGWCYRVSYMPVEFIRELASAIAGRPQDAPWFAPDVIRDADLAARLTLAHRMLEAGSERALSSHAHAPGQPACDPAADAPRIYDPLAAETAMLDALSTLIARHADVRPRPAPLAADEPRVDAMRERLAADLTSTVTLDDVAQAVGLSPFHAARLFTRTTGMPPHAWRNQLRLQRALAPLRAGVPVADVAAASGFVDQSHFTRHFKRMFGVPPGRWQAS
ncbi:AraC family transcriptional regulator [Burkholderia sp. AU42008]|uniref:AraC family transcriptional regulator n=1 Tax=unclassified Burkholderia TaxID=2613784 RepID=UPI000B7AD91D|nr:MULTISPECIES: AraC family transcriptional regulator [unclassified Burkholderia]RQU22073.1 AraC family transcriptional regulator [Burkholderia cenocepacia]MBR8233810.1 AraC family transcriptional regulator [Burkholderia sp. AU32357]MBY4872191.1 AraC family transcriptional regulator [Burkholderia sp. AU42008]OXI44470.1 AraC family transcriptional regulator [Burkholderia sp. AU17457]RQU25539.1 AraC family transcriptional regulator [Burkholderia cenocepacia]